MKALSICQSDLTGGAAIAAYRIHHSVLRRGVDSRLWVEKRVSDDWSVQTSESLFDRTMSKFRHTIGTSLTERLFEAPEPTMRTYNWIPSRWTKRINRADCDLVHLHWYNLEMLSIADVGRITKPIIQTIEDMWPFCGAEHYATGERWKSGYLSSNRPPGWRGIDIDRLTWKRKRRHWTSPWQLVAPSRWMADCISSSALMQDWPVAIIPNPVDTNVWKPLDKRTARSMFDLPADKPLLAFGAVGGTRNPRKGFDLMNEALERLDDVSEDTHVVVFGQSAPKDPPRTRFPTVYVGRLHDPIALCALYSAVDVYVNPAIQEAFGQTGSEAQACGLPVVAFRGTGLADVVEHERTGYLARHSDTADLAHGISRMLRKNGKTRTESSARTELSRAARDRAERLFSYESVGAQYAELYETVVSSRGIRTVS